MLCLNSPRLSVEPVISAVEMGRMDFATNCEIILRFCGEMSDLSKSNTIRLSLLSSKGLSWTESGTGCDERCSLPAKSTTESSARRESVDRHLRALIAESG